MSGHFLADSRVVIWTISRSDRLSARVKRTLADATASIAMSVATVWEIVVKHQAGKLVFDMSLAIDQRILIAQAQLQNLTILTPDDKIRNYDVRTLW